MEASLGWPGLVGVSWCLAYQMCQVGWQPSNSKVKLVSFIRQAGLLVEASFTTYGQALIILNPGAASKTRSRCWALRTEACESLTTASQTTFGHLASSPCVMITHSLLQSENKHGFLISRDVAQTISLTLCLHILPCLLIFFARFRLNLLKSADS